MPRICGGIPIQFAGTRKTTPRIRGGHPEEEGSLDAPGFRGLMKGRRQRVGPYFFICAIACIALNVERI